MPGMITVNHAATFVTVLLMASGPRTKYGSDEQDRTAAGQLRWEVQAAVTYVAEPGQRAQSEVLSVTVAADHDPAASIPPGTLVELLDLRCGVTAPEAREGGRGIRGGRLYWQASGLRPVHQGRKDQAA